MNRSGVLTMTECVDMLQIGALVLLGRLAEAKRWVVQSGPKLLNPKSGGKIFPPIKFL